MKLTLFFVLFSLLPSIGNAGTPSTRIIGVRTDEILAPFLWSGGVPVSSSEEVFQKTQAKADPLGLFRLAFHLLVTYERTEDVEARRMAIRILDFMIDVYEPADRSPSGYQWFYGFDYGDEVKAPWWSGMDGFFGPMTLYSAWQITGDERYRDIALKSAKRMLAKPSDGGILWRTDKGCWISEYSWRGMTLDQEYYVLNGHLWGLQALFMLQEASGDRDLFEAYQCAKEGTFARLPMSYNAKATWTIYKSKGKTINPTHYNLLEIAQFRALYHLTRESAFADAAGKRSQIFKNAYPMYLTEDKAKKTIEFSMIGAPSPYWTDTYPVTIKCTIDGKSISGTNNIVYEKQRPLHERLLLQLPVSDTPEKCELSILSNISVAIYNEAKFHQIPEHSDGELELDISAALLAKPTEKKGEFKVAIENNNDTLVTGEARLTLKVNRTLGPSDILGIVVYVDQPVQAGLLMTDVEGFVAHRSYPTLQTGQDNLILLNILGFENGDLLAGEIRNVSLRMHKGSIARDFKVRVKEAVLMRNPTEIGAFLKRNSHAYFPQQ